MRYFILFLSVFVIFVSCTKQTVTVPESKEDVLIKSKWHMTDVKLTVRDTFGRDSVYSLVIFDCKLDDNIEFKANFNAIHHTGDNKCYTNEATDYPFTWQLMDNGKTLGMYNIDDYFLGTPSVVGDISDLTDSKFTFKTKQVLVGTVIPPADTLKLTAITFQKQ